MKTRPCSQLSLVMKAHTKSENQRDFVYKDNYFHMRFISYSVIRYKIRILLLDMVHLFKIKKISSRMRDWTSLKW